MRSRAGIADGIRSKRIQKGMTQAQLAKKVGVGPALVGHWETGRAIPPAERVAEIERILGKISPDAASGPRGFKPVLGEWLSRSLERNNMTVAQLAERSGVSHATIYNLLNERLKKPRASTIEKIEKALSEQLPNGSKKETNENGNPSADRGEARGRSGTARGRIIQVALDLLKREPPGIRFSDLAQRIQNLLPKEPANTIRSTTGTLATLRPAEVYRPARGLFRLVEFREAEPAERQVPVAEKRTEERFYRPFADYLINDLEDCTRAIPLGGSRFADKWGTPDVIGKRASFPGDIVQFDPEIVSAEIKTDTAMLIAAFGQACSYKLFSHRSYLVIPKSARKEDIDRLLALCMIFGIGLVLFDSDNAESPHFDIQVRAARHEPDRFYVNQYMKKIEAELWQS